LDIYVTSTQSEAATRYLQLAPYKCPYEGTKMAATKSCFIRSLDGDWLQLDNCNIKLEIRRRFQREVARDGEGDDLLDQGAESMEFLLTGLIDIPTFQKVQTIFRSGTCWIIDPFEEKELKVCFARLRFDSETDEFEFLLIEDVV